MAAPVRPLSAAEPAGEGGGRQPPVEVTTVRPTTELQVEQPSAERLRLEQERAIAARRRWPWIGTLTSAGATLVTGAILGGIALDRSHKFYGALDQGAPMDVLLDLRGSARQMAFAADILLGSTALLGLITVVLRFSTATSRAPEPVDLERAYQVPGGGGP